MKKQTTLTLALAVLALAMLAFAARPTSTFSPGARTLMLAHNSYPYAGEYNDRLDRTIAAGVPFVVEEDLNWIDGRSLLIHHEKDASPNAPTLENYFFPKVAPIIEKSLKEGNKGNWPLITLYLDIKNDPEEHLEAINKVLDKYDAWLTKGLKTADITKMSALEYKPMMVIVEDKQNDRKQDFFYDRVPAGGKFRVFGSAVKFDDNPHKLGRDKRDERFAGLLQYQPEQLVTKHADNWRRWFGVDWHFIELCGPTHGNDWNADTEGRVKHFVDYGHRLGYLVSFYQLDGFPHDQDQGWGDEYNFGSKEAARLRWDALVKAHADFISTDQYEDVSAAIHSGR